MKENRLASIMVDMAYHAHVELGPGLFESVYEEVLCYELSKRKIPFKRQQIIPVTWKDIVMEKGFVADIVVDNSIIIEIKSIENLAPVHKKQLLTYLKLSGLKLGLLINFNETLIKNGITRIVNNL